MKRNSKTLRPGTGPGATRPRLGATSPSRKQRLLLLGKTARPTTPSLGNAAELTKVAPSACLQCPKLPCGTPDSVTQQLHE
eukprot:485966-Amphidinium_carterae.1